MERLSRLGNSKDAASMSRSHRWENSRVDKNWMAWLELVQILIWWWIIKIYTPERKSSYASASHLVEPWIILEMQIQYYCRFLYYNTSSEGNLENRRQFVERIVSRSEIAHSTHIRQIWNKLFYIQLIMNQIRSGKQELVIAFPCSSRSFSRRTCSSGFQSEK